LFSWQYIERTPTNSDCTKLPDLKNINNDDEDSKRGLYLVEVKIMAEKATAMVDGI